MATSKPNRGQKAWIMSAVAIGFFLTVVSTFQGPQPPTRAESACGTQAAECCWTRGDDGHSTPSCHDNLNCVYDIGQKTNLCMPPSTETQPEQASLTTSCGAPGQECCWSVNTRGGYSSTCHTGATCKWDASRASSFCH